MTSLEVGAAWILWALFRIGHKAEQLSQFLGALENCPRNFFFGRLNSYFLLFMSFYAIVSS
jgi:hypothetical protein